MNNKNLELKYLEALKEIQRLKENEKKINDYEVLKVQLELKKEKTKPIQV